MVVNYYAQKIIIARKKTPHTPTPVNRTDETKTRKTTELYAERVPHDDELRNVFRLMWCVALRVVRQSNCRCVCVGVKRAAMTKESGLNITLGLDTALKTRGKFQVFATKQSAEA